MIVLRGDVGREGQDAARGREVVARAVPPVAVPLLVVKLTVAGTVSGPVRRTVTMTDLAVSATVTCEAVKAKGGLEIGDGEDGRAGRAQGGAAAGRVQGHHDRLVAFGRAVGHGVDVDRLHGLAGGKGQRGRG